MEKQLAAAEVELQKKLAALSAQRAAESDEGEPEDE